MCACRRHGQAGQRLGIGNDSARKRTLLGGPGGNTVPSANRPEQPAGEPWPLAVDFRVADNPRRIAPNQERQPPAPRLHGHQRRKGLGLPPGWLSPLVDGLLQRVEPALQGPQQFVALSGSKAQPQRGDGQEEELEQPEPTGSHGPERQAGLRLGLARGCGSLSSRKGEASTRWVCTCARAAVGVTRTVASELPSHSASRAHRGIHRGAHTHS